MKFSFQVFLFFAYIKFVILVEEDLVITTKALGAELTSIKYKGREYLHDGKSFWYKQSPILFPTVGRLRNGKTKINGKDYEIPMHGFANNMTFQEIGKNSYVLKSNEETLIQYPFQFELYVSYLIEKNTLTVNYTVKNTNDTEAMLFGIGGHPGFKCDYYKEKSFIEFGEDEDNIKVIPVNMTNGSSYGLMSNETIDGGEFLKNKKILEIKKNSFENDAIVFKDIQSKSVFLNDDGKNILKFTFDQFNYLGIWSAQGNAPYVCLEPWYTTPDYVNSTNEFKDKKDIIKLEPNKTKEISFSVEFFEIKNGGGIFQLKSLTLLLLFGNLIILF